MSEYANLQSKTTSEIEENITFNDYLRHDIKMSAQTIAMDLVSVQPMVFPNPVYRKNLRCNKIKKILESI
jgi:hypothetical protein